MVPESGPVKPTNRRLRFWLWGLMGFLALLGLAYGVFGSISVCRLCGTLEHREQFQIPFTRSTL
ncbi:MAG: hypothetical protein NTV80_02975, partial [Verrucomicrobia bacterium]|nr:hypothetical protein [Verrucomicrobiota bacterium]